MVIDNSFNYSKYYSNWHTGTKEEYFYKKPLYSALLDLELNNLSRKSSILDFGCGFGTLLFHLQELGFKDILGVDSSYDQIEVARSNNLPVSHVSEKEFELWCNKNFEAFDVIFLFDVLEHIPVSKQIYFMKNLNTILKKNGIIYIKVPNANSMNPSRLRNIDWTHTSIFTEYSVRFVVENSGFTFLAFLNDESSLVPRFWYIPRKGIMQFYLKSIFRFFHRLRLYSEFGKEAFSFPIGYNLFLKIIK